MIHLFWYLLLIVAECEILCCFRATIIQHQSAKIGHANMGSVALPAVLRAGDASGQAQYSAGSLQKAQHSQLTNQQANNSYASPSVSFVCMPLYHFCTLLAFWLEKEVLKRLPKTDIIIFT